MAATEKKCSGPCGLTKPASHFFHRHARKKTGLSSRCKLCSKIARTAEAQTPAGKARLAHYYATKGKYSQKLTKYGLVREEYDAMVTKANGHCQICGNEFRGREPFVDHCHRTGLVRGLLCLLCNRMLGVAKDSAETLERGAAYLREVARGVNG